jgi:zinc D-Ala-D-Ala carboxypeptidase
VLLTPHFSVEELIRTDTGLPNDPPFNIGGNLVWLAESLLEPLRQLLGVPMVIHSAYRSEAVNAAVKGNPRSAHCQGRACDFHPKGLDIEEAFHRIRLSDLAYDKVLLETRGGTRWIHVQIAKPGLTPRRRAFRAAVGAHGTTYIPVP